MRKYKLSELLSATTTSMIEAIEDRDRAGRERDAMRQRAEAAELRAERLAAEVLHTREFYTRNRHHGLNGREELIRWLAMPWGDVDPLFPVTTVVHDELGNPIGTETNVNTELRDTWLEVVRFKSAIAEREGGGNSAAPLTEG